MTDLKPGTTMARIADLEETVGDLVSRLHALETHFRVLAIAADQLRRLIAELDARVPGQR